MSSLEKQNGDNLGGFCKLRIFEIEHLHTLPPTVDYEISGDIKINDFIGEILEIEVTPQTLKVDDGSSLSKGISYNHKITAHHPEDVLIDLQWIETYKNKNFMAVAYSTNGTKRVFGTVNMPLSLKAKRNNPANYSGRTGWSIEFSGLNLEPSPFLSGELRMAQEG